LALTWTTSWHGIGWDELEALYRAAALGNKSAALLQTVFTNSRFSCFARDADGRLVAAGRVLSDGADCAYVCDVAVHPDQQGRGVGAEVMSRLLAMCAGHRKIILYAVPGKEPFYRKFGFRRMRTAMAIFDDQAAAFTKGHIDAE
jgi:GNAT superfamily N-acetyltransferase